MEQKKIIVYSFQSKEKYNEYINNKEIYGSKINFVDIFWDSGTSFSDAYLWMKNKMKIKKLPLFAWKKKPDFRSMSREESKNKVLFEIELDRYKESDFMLWHFVLSKWYCSVDNKDYDQFEDYVDLKYKQHKYKHFNLLSKTDQKKIRKSWDNIFQLNKDSIIQVCFEKIEEKNVKSIVLFDENGYRIK